MLKVLIADDEINICNLIRHLLDWEDLGLALSGVAYNGIEAYQKILQDQPDILITDICMPGMDGLELIEKIKLAAPNIKVIVISGFKQFDYVYKAVKYGVVDFILKPINKSELNDTVKKLTSQIQKNNKNQRDIAHISELKKKIISSEAKLRNLFIMNVARKNLRIDNCNIAYINREFNYKFKPGYFCIAILHLSSKEEIDNLYQSIFSKISRQCFDDLKQRCFDMESASINNELILVFNYDIKLIETFKYDLTYFFTNVLALVSSYPLLDATLGIGGNFEKAEQIPLSHDQAILSIKSRLVLGCNRIINVQELNLNYETAILKLDEGDMKQLARTIEAQQKSAFFEISSRIWQQNLSIIQRYPYAVYDLYNKLLAYSADVFYEYFEIQQDIKNFKDDFDAKLNVQKSLTSLNDCFEEYIHELFDKNAANRNNNRKVIQVTKQYIVENCSNHLELEDAALIAHLSPAYLGILFKKETGTTFSEYLVKCRIDKAKELLKQIDYNINEIACLVGYKDAKHFSKVFKRVVGVKPTEFRKIYNI